MVAIFSGRGWPGNRTVPDPPSPTTVAVPNAVAERATASIDHSAPSEDASVSRGGGAAGSGSADGLGAEVALPELRILDALKAVQVSAEARRDVERVARVRAGRRALVSCSARAHAAANDALIRLQTGAGDVEELAELVAELAARHSSLESALGLYPAHVQGAPESVVALVHEAVGVMVGALPVVPTPFEVEVAAIWADKAQRSKAGVEVSPLAFSDAQAAVVQGWDEWSKLLAPVAASVKALQRQASAVGDADVDVALNLLAAVDSTVGEQIPLLLGKATAMRLLIAAAEDQRRERDNAERVAAR